MRYTLFLYNDEARFKDASEAQMNEELAVFGQYIGALQEAGVFVDTDWLQPTQTAAVVSLADGVTNIQDGAYAKTPEQLGGYFVIDVPDLEAAMSWALKCPSVHHGKVEIRPSAFPSEALD